MRIIRRNRLSNNEILAIIRAEFHAIRRPNEFLVDNVTFRHVPELLGEDVDVSDAEAFGVMDVEGRWNNTIFLNENGILSIIRQWSSIAVNDIREEVRHTLFHERRHFIQNELGLLDEYCNDLRWEDRPEEVDADRWASDQIRYCYA